MLGELLPELSPEKKGVAKAQLYDKEHITLEQNQMLEIKANTNIAVILFILDHGYSVVIALSGRAGMRASQTIIAGQLRPGLKLDYNNNTTVIKNETETKSFHISLLNIGDKITFNVR